MLKNVFFELFPSVETYIFYRGLNMLQKFSDFKGYGMNSPSSTPRYIPELVRFYLNLPQQPRDHRVLVKAQHPKRPNQSLA